eukprot:TRINITY_DN1657_c0_g1_i5.p1 TRINITY_DN1657_c0_g1~~TRINITY_DN1657_c0_g1_i5.p1  ORF type:complete len:179 (-),score=34.54 TRINITY_DN1657_c0_g1_i5:270-806(-)
MTLSAAMLSSLRSMSSAFIDLYALVKSFRAIKTPESDDDTHWLIFGVMRGVFRIIESLTFGYLLTSWCWLACELAFFWLITDASRAKLIFNHCVSRLLSPIVDKLTREDFDSMWQRLRANVDADGDGKVSLEELKTFLGARKFRAIANTLDRDGDGKLSLEEVKLFLKELLLGRAHAE